MNFLKEHRLLVLSILAYLAGVGLAALIWFNPATVQARMPKAPPNQPVDGWVVCEDLGLGEIPGLPDLRQRFRMCHPDGWEYLAYCLEPGLPMPSLGSTCTETGDGLFNCGDNVQTLRLYAVIATPTPRPTRTATATATATATPAPTRRVRTSFPPRQAASTPVCDPPEICETGEAARPRPGGPGNLAWLGLFAVSVVFLVILQGGLILAHRRKP